MTHPSNSTIDVAEKHKFTQLATEWWKEEGAFSMLHKLTPLRLEYIVQHLNEHFGKEQRLRILDIGCGGGLASVPLARLGHQVLGIDMVPENIDEAMRYSNLHKISGVQYRCCSAEALHEEIKNGFDVVIALEVIEHVANINLFVQTMCDLVRNNGLLFISTLNQTLVSYMEAIIGAEYILGWVPIGTHDWEKFVTPANLEKMLYEYEVQISDRVGICYKPLLNSWHLCDSTAVNYMVCAIKKRG